MSDEKALLAAIWEHPNEDTPRLVYADWLQENGQPERGEFIRQQIELTQHDEDSPRFLKLQKTIKATLKVWDKSWRKQFPGTEKDWPWHRGFIEPDDRGIDSKDLFRLSAKTFAVAPTRSFCIIDDAVPLKDLIAWPHLHRLNTFSMRNKLPRGNWIKLVQGCNGFRNVSKLYLIDCPITVPELEQLLNGFLKQRIDALFVNGSRISDDGLRMLLNHPMILKLREFVFNDIRLTAAGVRTLAESQYYPVKPELDLSFNRIGDAGVKELVRWKGLERITDLSLDHAEIGDAGVVTLAKCKNVRSVRTLRLHGNVIGARGVEALIATDHFESLKDISINLTDVPSEAVKRLRAKHRKAMIG